MKILLAVISDLYLFAKGLLKPKSKELSQKSLPPASVTTPVTTKINIATSVKPNDAIKAPDILNDNGNAGYICVGLAKVFVRPVWVVDTVIATLSLGKKIQIQNYQGRFVNIIAGDFEGWVLKDEVTTEKQQVWPELINSEIYEASSPVTVSIRGLINDEFFTTELYLPLQATEYVTYRLLERNLNLPWPKIRPREVGLWHEILKGQLGIVSSLEARTGSIMEGVMEDDKPFLAYVEAVAVDGTLEITSVGRLREGQYRRETLSKAQVFALRPVYIQRI